MNAYFSEDNFNNQTEYDNYINLDIREQAEDDFILDVEYMSIGYRHILICTTDGRKQLLNRITGVFHGKKHHYSIAVDAAYTGTSGVGYKALVMSGPEFRPLIITADDQAKTCKIADAYMDKAV